METTKKITLRSLKVKMSDNSLKHIMAGYGGTEQGWSVYCDNLATGEPITECLLKSEHETCEDAYDYLDEKYDYHLGHCTCVGALC